MESKSLKNQGIGCKKVLPKMFGQNVFRNKTRNIVRQFNIVVGFGGGTMGSMKKRGL